MSGGTDRREDEEKFAEWETDWRLWQVESRWKTVTNWDQGCIGEVCTEAENHCENRAQNTRCCTVHSEQHH